MSSEIRWYKGKYKVEILLKTKKEKGKIQTYKVKALEDISKEYGFLKGLTFTTVPRLLWRHKRS